MRRDILMGMVGLVVMAVTVFVGGYAKGKDDGERWGVALRDEALKRVNAASWVGRQGLRPGFYVVTDSAVFAAYPVGLGVDSLVRTAERSRNMLILQAPILALERITGAKGGER